MREKIEKMDSDRVLTILRSCSGDVEQETLKNALGRVARRKLKKIFSLKIGLVLEIRAKIFKLAIIAVVHE